MIEKIKIKDFRSIDLVELNDLGNLNVFVGENNSGKSTVLNAIRIFNELNYKPSKNDVRHGEEQFEIIMVKSLSDYYYDRIHDMIRPTDIFSDFIEYFERNGKENRARNTKIYKEEFRKFINNNYLLGKTLRKLGVRMVGFTNNSDEMEVRYDLVSSQFRPFNVTIDSSNSFLLKAFLDKPAVVEDERNFNSEVTGEPNSITNSIFSLFLDSISEGQGPDLEKIGQKRADELTIGEINSLLTEKISGTSRDFLSVINNKFNSYIDNDFTINWNFEEDLRSRLRLETQFLNKENNPVDFLSTGSGTRSLYILALLETYVEKTKGYQGKPGLFLIEEPELYLYPILERRMSLILKDISENNQMFITTHSSALVSNFELDNIYLVESESPEQKKGSNYRKLEDLAELVDKIGFNAHPIFSGRYVFLVEGKEDIRQYKKIISQHFPDKLEESNFIKVNGVRNIEVGITCQFLKNTELVNRLFIITDSDGRKPTKIKAQYKNVFEGVFSKEEIEDIFENRLYVTENAMNLECLSISYSTLKDIQVDEFNMKLEKFLQNDQNQKIINNQMQSKSKKGGRLYSDEEKEIIKFTLNNGTSQEKLEVLKKHLLVSNLLKSFRNQVYNFPMISDLDKDLQKEFIPDLLNKLTLFFER